VKGALPASNAKRLYTDEKSFRYSFSKNR